MQRNETLIGGPFHGQRIEPGRISWEAMFIPPVDGLPGEPPLLIDAKTRYLRKSFEFERLAGFRLDAMVWEHMAVDLRKFAKSNQCCIRLKCDWDTARQVEKATGFFVSQFGDDEAVGVLESLPTGSGNPWSQGNGGSYFGTSLLELGRMMERTRNRTALASLARSFPRTFARERANIENGGRRANFGQVAFEASRLAECPEACFVFYAAAVLFESLTRQRLDGPAPVVPGVVVEGPALGSVKHPLTGRPVQIIRELRDG